MSALFSPPKMPQIKDPPVTPTINQDEVQRRADEERRNRIMAGRASQFMSDPLAQLTPGHSNKRYLGTL